MQITQEFRQAVVEENILRIKIMLKDSLLVDPTFNQFNEMLHIVEQSRIDLWVDDSEDDVELPENQLDWTEEYLNMTLVGLVNCFSKKRVNCLKAVINKKIPVIPKKTTVVNTMSNDFPIDIIYRKSDVEVFKNFGLIRDERMTLNSALSDINGRKQLRKSDIIKIRNCAKRIVSLWEKILER